MVARDDAGEPVRDALLWNDTRSAAAAADLIAEHGGPQACADAVGSVLVASFTATKLRWLRDHEPAAAARVADVLLPHDYVSLHACAAGTAPFTDRGDASGTGYFSTATGEWRPDLAAAALGPRGGAAPRRRAGRGRRRDRLRGRGQRGHRRQHGRRARAVAGTGRRRPVRRHLRGRLDGERRPGRRRHRGRHRLRGRHRRLPADGRDHERRRDPRPPVRAARASTTPGSPRSPWRPRPAPTA